MNDKKLIDYDKLAFLDNGCICGGNPYKTNKYTINPFTLKNIKGEKYESNKN